MSDIKDKLGLSGADRHKRVWVWYVIVVFY